MFTTVKGMDASHISEILTMVEGLDVDINNILEIADYDIREGFKSENAVSTLLEVVNRWKDNLGLWKDYTLLYKHFEELAAEGLVKFKENLVKVLKKSDIKYSELENIYMNSILEALIKSYISESEELTVFNSITTEERIKEYNNLIEEIERITLEQIKNKLIDNLPDNKSQNREEVTALAGLTKIIRSKGRGTSIRKIFQENGNIIKSLTPCLLMSPLSVAQYIDLDFPKFDLVIFDEASQIRTGIAVGAMSRAKNCIIVGDPNQMPPTSFFGTQNIDEENIHIEDLESLLEDCLAINMPQKYLTCHYRSKSESLIAFSNNMYYGNKMLTFPSPNDSISKVKFVKTEGIYDRGGSRTNKEEAKLVVDEIIKRLNNKEKDTIGVVTFNIMQQELIDDLLQEALAKNPTLEKFAKSMKEPIFIKNLENVQGDERDVILFSITYGKDINGKFYQNFGPLSNKGGWRRLNVAVSRSRSEMVVFSSFTFDEIHISPTTSEGVVGLKTFLEFAQKGISVLGKKNIEKENTRTEILYSIKDFLSKNGFESEINFGVSKLTLEIVVKNPLNSDEYICSILIDSKQYADRNTIRDRNRLIPKVLSGKGWNIYRVWTVSYFENKDKIFEDLKLYLEDLIEKNKLLKNEEQARSLEEQKIHESTTDIIENNIKEEQNIIKKEQEVQSFAEFETDSGENIKINENYDSSNDVYDDLESLMPVTLRSYTVYTGDAKYSKISINDVEDNVILDILQNIIYTESPIMEDLLMRRVLEQFKDSKLSFNIKNRLLEILTRVNSNVYKDSTGKVYFGKVDEESYNEFRLPDEHYRRDLEMISDREIANIIYLSALENAINYLVEKDEDELIKTAIRRCGYMVCTSKAVKRVSICLEYLFEKSLLIKKDNKIFIANK